MDTGQRAEPDITATCVVVRPLGAPLPPPQLNEALKARAFTTIHCDDVFEALARLCVLIADQRAERCAVSLVVIDRDEFSDVEGFLEALETYVPSVAPWDYDDEAGLRPLVIDEPLAQEPEPDPAPVVQIPRRPIGPPRLKLSEDLTPEDIEQSEPVASDDDADETEPTMSQMLTDEELAMLLGDDEPPTKAGDRS